MSNETKICPVQNRINNMGTNQSFQRDLRRVLKIMDCNIMYLHEGIEELSKIIDNLEPGGGGEVKVDLNTITFNNNRELQLGFLDGDVTKVRSETDLDFNGVMFKYSMQEHGGNILLTNPTSPSSTNITTGNISLYSKGSNGEHRSSLQAGYIQTEGNEGVLGIRPSRLFTDKGSFVIPDLEQTNFVLPKRFNGVLADENGDVNIPVGEIKLDSNTLTLNDNGEIRLGNPSSTDRVRALKDIELSLKEDVNNININASGIEFLQNGLRRVSHSNFNSFYGDSSSGVNVGPSGITIHESSGNTSNRMYISNNILNYSFSDLDDYNKSVNSNLSFPHTNSIDRVISVSVDNKFADRLGNITTGYSDRLDALENASSREVKIDNKTIFKNEEGELQIGTKEYNTNVIEDLTLKIKKEEYGVVSFSELSDNHLLLGEENGYYSTKISHHQIEFYEDGTRVNKIEGGSITIGNNPLIGMTTLMRAGVKFSLNGESLEYGAYGISKINPSTGEYTSINFPSALEVDSNIKPNMVVSINDVLADNKGNIELPIQTMEVDNKTITEDESGKIQLGKTGKLDIYTTRDIEVSENMFSLGSKDVNRGAEGCAVTLTNIAGEGNAASLLSTSIKGSKRVSTSMTSNSNADVEMGTFITTTTVQDTSTNTSSTIKEAKTVLGNSIAYDVMMTRGNITGAMRGSVGQDSEMEFTFDRVIFRKPNESESYNIFGLISQIEQMRNDIIDLKARVEALES